MSMSVWTSLSLRRLVFHSFSNLWAKKEKNLVRFRWPWGKAEVAFGSRLLFMVESGIKAPGPVCWRTSELRKVQFAARPEGNGFFKKNKTHTLRPKGDATPVVQETGNNNRDVPRGWINIRLYVLIMIMAVSYKPRVQSAASPFKSSQVEGNSLACYYQTCIAAVSLGRHYVDFSVSFIRPLSKQRIINKVFYRSSALSFLSTPMPDLFPDFFFQGIRTRWKTLFLSSLLSFGFCVCVWARVYVPSPPPQACGPAPLV